MRFTLLAFAMASLVPLAAAAADLPAPAPDGKQVPPLRRDTMSELTKGFDLVEEVKAREPTPQEILEIKKLWDELRKAQERPVEDQPKPTISMVNLDLSPGATPPLVRISSQTGVVLTFLDAEGKKWPVDLIRNLSANQLEVEETPALKDQNAVFVKAKRSGGIGNIAVFLRDYDTPILITLLAGQKNVDYRVDFRVPAVFGKKGAPIPAQPAEDRLIAAVMGITPSGCKKMQTDHQAVMAWVCKNDQIVRATGVLLAPATIDGKKIVGQSNTTAWLIPKTPIVSMLMGGSPVNVRLEVSE